MEVKLKVNIVLSFDAVVCGSGPAGLAAAVQARRCGLSVALIERSGCFGGNMTSSGVCHLLGGRRWDQDSRKMVRETGGLFDEITDALIRDKKAIDPDSVDVFNYNPYGWYPRMAAGVACDMEALKRCLDDLVIREGIRPFLFTTIIKTELSDRRLKRIYAQDQGGITAFEAKTFIDATGDAELSFLSGLPTLKGRDSDHLMTPASLIMHVDHVDMKAYVAYQNAHQQPKLIDIINDLRARGIWTFPFEIFIAIGLAEDDVCMVNTLRQVGVDGTDADSLTLSMIQGREESERLLGIMKAYFPGFGNARMRFTASRIGIRESRRILGRSMTSLEDALEGRRYEDEVIKTTYNFDLPDPKRPSFDPMLGSVDNPNARRKHVAIYAPYSVMLVDQLDNLITAGRCISVEREVLGPMRVTGPAMMGGQAAGFGAALANKNDCDAAMVDGKEIKKCLQDAGCII
jgi:hypothetical protein